VNYPGVVSQRTFPSARTERIEVSEGCIMWDWLGSDRPTAWTVGLFRRGFKRISLGKIEPCGDQWLATASPAANSATALFPSYHEATTALLAYYRGDYAKLGGDEFGIGSVGPGEGPMTLETPVDEF
jgi:hypothetical protein